MISLLLKRDGEFGKVFGCGVLEKFLSNHSEERVRNKSRRALQDKDVVLAAVSQNGCALRNAAEELRADKDFVLAAVSQDCRALQYAAEELRAEKDLVLAAVSGRAARVNPFAVRNKTHRLAWPHVCCMVL